jgi:hypothetical protein
MIGYVPPLNKHNTVFQGVRWKENVTGCQRAARRGGNTLGKHGGRKMQREAKAIGTVDPYDERTAFHRG